MAINWLKIKKVYFIGIKGVAMSGLAVICKQRGLQVTGSDVAKKFITDKVLIAAGIEFFEGFAVNNLDWQPDLIVVGTSWGVDHVEVAEAKKRKLTVISDSELRGLLSSEKQTIAVTGVHGKTTTTSLLAYIFKIAGLKPSYLIGTGIVPVLGGNAAWNSGKYFIVEGDEYSRSREDKTPKFLDLTPETSIITSLEWEHVDIYENVEAVEKVFAQLIAKTKSLVVACGDWSGIKKIINQQKKSVVTYGLNKDNLWQAFDVQHSPAGMSFRVRKDGVELGQFTLKLFGQHHVLNALSCIIVALSADISLDNIRKAFSTFIGAERRFEVKEKGGITFVDDYGHHPTEIKTTLQAIRQRYQNRKIYCVFQSHTATRTRALLKDFAQSFDSVDKVFVVDIFTSAREASSGITAEQLVSAIKKYQPEVTYSGSIDQTINNLQDQIEPGLVVVTMGAGDVYTVRDELLKTLD